MAYGASKPSDGGELATTETPTRKRLVLYSSSPEPQEFNWSAVQAKLGRYCMNPNVSLVDLGMPSPMKWTPARKPEILDSSLPISEPSDAGSNSPQTSLRKRAARETFFWMAKPSTQVPVTTSWKRKASDLFELPPRKRFALSFEHEHRSCVSNVVPISSPLLHKTTDGKKRTAPRTLVTLPDRIQHRIYRFAVDDLITRKDVFVALFFASQMTRREVGWMAHVTADFGLWKLFRETVGRYRAEMGMPLLTSGMVELASTVVSNTQQSGAGGTKQAKTTKSRKQRARENRERYEREERDRQNQVRRTNQEAAQELKQKLKDEAKVKKAQKENRKQGLQEAHDSQQLELRLHQQMKAERKRQKRQRNRQSRALRKREEDRVIKFVKSEPAEEPQSLPRSEGPIRIKQEPGVSDCGNDGVGATGANASQRAALTVRYRDGDVVGAAAPELGAENKGRAMLEKMGWKAGMALGWGENKGSLTPVTQIVKTTKAGLG
jgi:hypothetical protein